jgi:hypothetical protein
MGVYGSEEQNTSGVGHITHHTLLFCSVSGCDGVDRIVTTSDV